MKKKFKELTGSSSRNTKNILVVGADNATRSNVILYLSAYKKKGDFNAIFVEDMEIKVDIAGKTRTAKIKNDPDGLSLKIRDIVSKHEAFIILLDVSKDFDEQHIRNQVNEIRTVKGNDNKFNNNIMLVAYLPRNAVRRTSYDVAANLARRLSLSSYFEIPQPNLENPEKFYPENRTNILQHLWNWEKNFTFASSSPIPIVKPISRSAKNSGQQSGNSSVYARAESSRMGAGESSSSVQQANAPTPQQTLKKRLQYEFSSSLNISRKTSLVKEYAKKCRDNGWTIDLSYLNLSRLDLREENLQGANLQGANLMEAILQDANLRGADLRAAKLARANLEGATLRDANLEGATLLNADLQGANLQGAYLKEANLQGSYLQGANLEVTILERANLEGADLRGVQSSNLDEIQGTPAFLPDGTQPNRSMGAGDGSSSSSAQRVTLQQRMKQKLAENLKSTISGVAKRRAIDNYIEICLENDWTIDLSNLDLRRAFLAGVDLTGADLSGADLTSTYLARAILARADLRGAKNANLTGTIGAPAFMPNDSKPNRAESSSMGAGESSSSSAGQEMAMPKNPYLKARCNKLLLDPKILTMALNHKTLARYIGVKPQREKDNKFVHVVEEKTPEAELELLLGFLEGIKRPEKETANNAPSSSSAPAVITSEQRNMKLRIVDANVKEKGRLIREYAEECRANGWPLDLSNLELNKVDLADTNLRGANLRWTNLQGADLTGADLRGADLRGVDLQGADLTRADLTGAGLTGGANLTGANLTGADLTGTNLRGAHLTGAYIRGATNLEKALGIRIIYNRRNEMAASSSSSSQANASSSSPVRIIMTPEQQATKQQIDLCLPPFKNERIQSYLAKCRENNWPLDLTYLDLMFTDLDRIDLRGVNLERTDLWFTKNANLDGIEGTPARLPDGSRPSRTGSSRMGAGEGSSSSGRRNDLSAPLPPSSSSSRAVIPSAPYIEPDDSDTTSSSIGDDQYDVSGDDIQQPDPFAPSAPPMELVFPPAPSSAPTAEENGVVIAAEPSNKGSTAPAKSNNPYAIIADPDFDEDKFKEWFEEMYEFDPCCPLSLEIMRNPVSTTVGSIYEISAIQEYFAQGENTDSKIDPLTLIQLRDLSLTEERLVRNQIEKGLKLYKAKMEKKKAKEEGQPSPTLTDSDSSSSEKGKGKEKMRG